MRLEYNTEEYTLVKFNKYIFIVSIAFIIFALSITVTLLITLKQFAAWLFCIIFGIIIGALFVYFMMKRAVIKEPTIFISDDEICCNFRRVRTPRGSLKEKIFGPYIQVKEECKMQIISQYKVTKKQIIVYGYDVVNPEELTGFTIERFFDEDQEILITTWLQNHILNVS